MKFLPQFDGENYPQKAELDLSFVEFYPGEEHCDLFKYDLKMFE